MLESAWRDEKVNASEWLQAWGVQRCGRDNPKVRQAWSLLANTVYADAEDTIYEHHMRYCPTAMPHGSRKLHETLTFLRLQHIH